MTEFLISSWLFLGLAASMEDLDSRELSTPTALGLVALCALAAFWNGLLRAELRASFLALLLADLSLLLFGVGLGDVIFLASSQAVFPLQAYPIFCSCTLLLAGLGLWRQSSGRDPPVLEVLRCSLGAESKAVKQATPAIPLLFLSTLLVVLG